MNGLATEVEMEELRAKHRKERQDLQARITQKKKQATKKTRKGVNDECAALEKELIERQERELDNLNGISQKDAIVEGADGAGTPPPEAPVDINTGPDDHQKSIQHVSVADPHDSTSSDMPGPNRKPNRQRARLARRAAEQEAAATQAAEEAANMPDQRQTERTRMLEEFKKRGLREKEIRPDGHCLYSAVADQMSQLGLGLQSNARPVATKGVDAQTEELPYYKQVRSAAADYISDHPDEFLPFLEEPLDEYTHKVKDTAEWGGQLELLALAKTYDIRINVLQGNGRVEKIESEPEVNDKEIWLAYYRHGFGLGEHYNSLRKAA